MAEIFWHNLSIEEVLKILGADVKHGLKDKEVGNRQEKAGKNKLPEEKPLSSFSIFLDQIKSPLIYILIIAGIVTLLLREYTDSVVIFGAVILNTIVGFTQERKASQALSALKKMVKHEAKVLREGSVKVVDSSDVVSGDIFILTPGDKVPADGRIIEASGLQVNEMALTGEWLPATKKVEIFPKETTLADRDNMVYMGTTVEDGKGKVVVTAIGSAAEIGKVAEMVKETKEEKTPLQIRLANFSKIIGIIVTFVAAFIFVEGIITGNSVLEMFTTSVAVAVAAIPEGLPVAMTVILALGMQRILKKKGLVRKLLAAETLGSTSIIATDKTCTLTEGKMWVEDLFVLGNKERNKHLMLKAAALTNQAFIQNPKSPEKEWQLRGNPTDKALLLVSILAGVKEEDVEKTEERIYEIPFDAVKRYAATFTRGVKLKDKLNIYVLGAPEALMDMSKNSPAQLKEAQKRLEELTKKGYRVVGAAHKEIKNKGLNHLEDKVKELTFLGLFAMRDPLRKDVKEAIRNCLAAGMRPIIVTGDHKLTAKSIALELGLPAQDKNIIEGKDLEQMTDKELDKRLKGISVFARVEPKHKIRIIEAWQKKGEVVAMTGDGINDAPALKKADIGLALGSGTEVAKETSDLILLNDSFSIILAAVEEGRAILDSIRRVITYLLAGSFSEVILIAGALLAGFPLPVLPAQILWVNLIEDGLPDIALAFEEKEKDLMSRKPQKKTAPLLTREMKTIIFVIGILTNILLFGLFFWLLRQNHDISYIRTIMFGALTIDSLLFVFSCKSLRRNIWHINPFSNKFLLLTVLFGFAMLFAAVYLPALQTLLKTVPLVLNDWLIILAIGVINLVLIEITKWFFIPHGRLRKRTTNL